jgi:hypothetical protein
MSTNDIVVNDGTTGVSSIKTIQQILTSAAVDLDDLTDVAITAPAANDRLIYNGSLWVNRQPPGISIFYNNLTNSFGGTRYVYNRMPPANVLTTLYASQFTLNPATNYITYTGTQTAIFRVSLSTAFFTTSDARVCWGCLILNPTVASTPATTTPALPAGAIAQTLIKNYSRNATDLLEMTSNSTTIQLAPNSEIGYFQSGVSNNDQNHSRDFRLVLDFVNYI